MTTTCKVCRQERYIHAAGMCRTCRYKQFDNTMRTIADAKPRLLELVTHYGSVAKTMKAVGLSQGTVQRIKHASPDERLKRGVYDRIMTHTPSTPPAAVQPEQREPATRSMVAKYATTPEGQEYIERCRAPRKYRRYMEVAA